MRPTSREEMIAGPAGQLQVVIDEPAGVIRGLALVAHPHPLYGGNLENKVAATLARAMNDCGLVALRPNFRGVGKSQGSFDDGAGEQLDLMAVYQHFSPMYPNTELAIAGFSFGSFVGARVSTVLVGQGVNVRHRIMVGTAVKRFDVPEVPADTLVVHGESDEVVSLADLLQWAGPQHLPVLVFPGVSHFFHGALTPLRNAVRNYLLRPMA